MDYEPSGFYKYFVFSGDYFLSEKESDYGVGMAFGVILYSGIGICVVSDSGTGFS